MGPVVALDIDGTLGDYHGHLLRFAAEWADEPMLMDEAYRYNGSLDLATFMGWDKAKYRSMKLAFRQGGMKRTMPVLSGARLFAEALRQMGCEVWIATTRPYQRLDNIDPDTQEWMRRHGIHYDYMIYDEDKYRVLTERVDRARIIGCLEDLPDKWDRAEELGLRPILRHTMYNSSVERSPSVRTFGEALHIITGRLAEWKASTKH